MEIRYFSLALAIAFGVMFGSLGSSFVQWSIAAYIAKGAAEEMSRSLEESSRQLKQEQAQRAERARAMTRQQREKSSKGKVLRADCAQWRSQSDRMNTKYVQQEMNRRCGAYERYLDTGR